MFFYITKCAGWIGTIPMLFGSVGWQRARIGLCSQLKVKKWNHFDQWNIVPLYYLDCCVCVGILSFMFGFSCELLLLRERYDSWILSSNIFKAIGIFFTIGISRYIFFNMTLNCSLPWSILWTQSYRPQVLCFHSYLWLALIRFVCQFSRNKIEK